MDPEGCIILTDQNAGSDALTLIFIMMLLVITYITSLCEEHRLNH